MPRTQGVLLLTAAVCCAAVLTGCSDDDPPSSVSSAASKAASAAESLGSQASSAAASLASGAASALSSATAEAGRRLDEIKGGVDVTSDIGLGDTGTDKDGLSTVEVSATNTTDATRSFAVQVDFTDSSGERLDTTVVTLADVPAGQKASATARSNRDLPGEVKTKVARAVRY